jgi:hypothetical protein
MIYRTREKHACRYTTDAVLWLREIYLSFNKLHYPYVTCIKFEIFTFYQEGTSGEGRQHCAISFFIFTIEKNNKHTLKKMTMKWYIKCLF